ncbi:MAG: DUF554 domain-containing protein [Chitinispirillia bacterium]|nr:DUF554 domain-containing protein [Chitinispirillia bacterium]MCL2241401.1 DUF554 domain-containing protein [Chitinispirillia bacterium]
MGALWGTTINAAAVVLGCLAGLLLPRMPERMRELIMQGLGLAILFLGVSMGLKTENFIFVVISLVLGAVIGELLQLDLRLLAVGEALEKNVKEVSVPGLGAAGGRVADGFVTATLIFCVGAMAVLGAIDSGLRGDHTLLYTKSLLDGITAMILTSTLGFGVGFSAAVIFLYQGMIALSAKWITYVLSASELDMIVTEVGAVGGVLIAGIGISMLHIKKINVTNLLPSIFIAAGLVWANAKFGFL